MILTYIFVFIFGTIIGSFLNVVVLRYNTGFSIVHGGSKCFLCGHKLRWFELIPILSFVAQKGRCRECMAKISWQYPVIEILTGLIFLLIFNFSAQGGPASGWQFLPITIYYLLIACILIIIAVYDLRHQIIPNGMVYAFDILALLLILIPRTSLLVPRTENILTGIIFAGFFALLWLVSKGTWMGLGDAKLALGIGWLLGSEKTFIAALMAFWIGAIVGIGMMIFKKNKYGLKSQIAFGPFLILGAGIAFFWSDAITKFIFHI